MMNFNMKICAMVVVSFMAATVEYNRVVGAPAGLSGDVEYRQSPDQLLELPAKQQHLARGEHLNGLNSLNNNGADVASTQQQQAMSRVRRSIASGNQGPLLPTQQQWPTIDDEHMLTRQLPDLIAQARNDKNVERVLLRLLINASLRPSSSINAGAPQSNARFYNNRVDRASWQDSSIDGGLNNYDGVYPRTSSRLDQVIESLAGVDSVSNEPGQTYQQDRYQSALDKREYIKPCSFNAVSCAKNPFRRMELSG